MLQQEIETIQFVSEWGSLGWKSGEKVFSGAGNKSGLISANREFVSAGVAFQLPFGRLSVHNAVDSQLEIALQEIDTDYRTFLSGLVWFGSGIGLVEGHGFQLLAESANVGVQQVMVDALQCQFLRENNPCKVLDPLFDNFQFCLTSAEGVRLIGPHSSFSWDPLVSGNINMLGAKIKLSLFDQHCLGGRGNDVEILVG